MRIRSVLAAMPGYKSDSSSVTEETLALREEVEHIEEIALKENWPLRLGFLWHENNDIWRNIIDQCDTTDEGAI